jgi:hypothetical protein
VPAGCDMSASHYSLKKYKQLKEIVFQRHEREMNNNSFTVKYNVLYPNVLFNKSYFDVNNYFKTSGPEIRQSNT